MKNFKLIDDYYLGKMSTESKVEFEESLKINDPLKSEYDSYIASQKLIDRLIGKELLIKLSDIAESEESSFLGSDSLVIKSSEKSKVISGRIVPINGSKNIDSRKSAFNKKIVAFGKLRLAASILVLVSVCISLFYLNRSNGFSNITEQNISYLDISQMRGNNNIQKYEKLIQLQADGNYIESNNIIDDLLSSNPITYDYLVYFKGQNNFRLKNYREAEIQFDQVIRMKLPKYLEHAQLMQVFTAIESKNYTLAYNRIDQLEMQPLFSYKNVLAKVKVELQNK